MLQELKKLQSGTDIRGIATEYNGIKNLTPDLVRALGNGFLEWLKNNKNIDKGSIKIAVGIDSRLSGLELKEALIKVFLNSGFRIYDCGMCTTPAMFMTTILEDYSCDGAIMITASHLPYYYNGLKFFTKEGGCEKEDIVEIIEYSCLEGKSCAGGSVENVDFIDVYSNILVNKIRKSVNSEINYEFPLEGKKIIVDAGNGAGGFFAHKVLAKLGADIEGSQFTEPDGNFPNHIPNPENKEAMESIKKAVLQNKADLGIIFDTDVDRAAVVSSDGTEINKNALIALISAIVLEETPSSTIVTDSVTSAGLAEFITNLGGIHHRFKRGYKNVINEAKRLNEKGSESNLAIETSGHAALKENYFLDDGAYLVAKILIKMAKLKEEGKDISSLIENLKYPKESRDIRINIKRADFRTYGEMIIEGLKKYVEQIEGWTIEPQNYEGVRINCNKKSGDGWLLLRLSLHEPVLALNVESDSDNGTNVMLEKLILFLKKYEELEDISKQIP
ncbi:phosphomannomutase/phosphoglucomutase [Clostridium sp. BL-8]|uniref:phosphomannomutase/phosphoglucomutase n=1 Tax=Clostridium sp. BL-8 TaxID=349938 RepID=UPI00098C73CC|nr:phosphomannomutase/phosphoglucomutase [Clostridium sp. BL-8]OOM79155.1 phosphomannomutase/phosphoglucomutase [Clostridium sp. BL-8]